MFPVSIDETASKLQALAIAEATLGDTERAQVASAMLELYLAGRIEVTFDETGEPVAQLIESPIPIQAFPLFPSPEPLGGTEKRQIGFRVN